MSLFSPSDLGMGSSSTGAASAVSAPPKDIFAETQRKGWHKGEDTAARCDLSQERIAISPHAGVTVITLWKKSIKGRLLTDIKADDDMVEKFATKMTDVIRKVLGHYLSAGNWAICATPKRRHLTKNFACRIAEQIGHNLSIPYYEDVALAHTRQRVNVDFDLGTLPAEPNLIIFDDFVTTGSTISSTYRLLEPLGKNLVFFVGINNNL